MNKYTTQSKLEAYSERIMWSTLYSLGHVYQMPTKWLAEINVERCAADLHSKWKLIPLKPSTTRNWTRFDDWLLVARDGHWTFVYNPDSYNHVLFQLFVSLAFTSFSVNYTFFYSDPKISTQLICQTIYLVSSITAAVHLNGSHAV